MYLHGRRPKRDHTALVVALCFIAIVGLALRDCALSRDCEAMGGAWIRNVCVERVRVDPRGEHQ